MMKGIAQDFVRYVMHVQVVRNDPAPPAPAVQNVQQTSSDDAADVGLPGRRGRARSPTARPGARGAVADGDPAAAAARQAAARRPSRRPSSRTSGRRRRATRRARAGRARSSSSATARPEPRLPMRDFTDDLRELRRRLDEAEAYLRVDEPRSRLDRAGGRDGAGPTCGTTPTRPRRSPPSTPTSATTSATFDALASALDDVEVLHELAREEDDESQEPEIADGVADDRPRRSTSSSCAACSPASTTRPTASCRSTPRTAASTPRTGARCCCACTSAGPSGAGFDVRASTASSEGTEAGHPVGRVHDHRPLRLRPDDQRAGHAPAGADQPVRQPGPPPDELRRRAGVAGDGRPRRRAQRRRHPHGGVPGVGRRRPARQQDVVGGAPDPRADRAGRQLAGGAQPAAEPGEGDEPAEGDGRGQGRGGAGRRARRASPASRRRSAGAARSAATCCSRTRWSRTCAPRSRPATSTACSTATSTSSWRATSAGAGATADS